MKQPVKRKVAEANGINNNKTVYTLVIDGNNLLKISSVDKKTNDRGEVYGAVMTFIRKLGELLLHKDFDYCIVSWDGMGSGVMRYRLYPDYKANRDKHYELFDAKTDYDKKVTSVARYIIKNKTKGNTVRGETDEESLERQKSIIKEILEELCIRHHEFDDVEGDDIVAYYVKNRRPNEKIVIMSSDRDMTQFISDNVAIWNPRLGRLIKAEDSIKELGITHENIVLEKILCGDVSDNIKGVKGLGEQTLVKYFPEIVDKKMDLEAIVRRSKELLDERKAEKKKPLLVLENIVNGVTDGCQGDELYEINRKIIDLSEPLLTEEARKELDDTSYAVMDTSDRSIKNAYKIIQDNRMFDMLDERKFGDILAPYTRIIMMENKRYKEYLANSK